MNDFENEKKGRMQLDLRDLFKHIFKRNIFKKILFISLYLTVFIKN